MNGLTTPWGDFVLTRHPERPGDPLRAWDTADELLLRHLAGDTGEPSAASARAENHAGGAPGHGAGAAAAGTVAPAGAPVDVSGGVVVLGDRWGTLATALAARRLEQLATGPLVQITDSYL